jgi:hypothetical protein
MHSIRSITTCILHNLYNTPGPMPFSRRAGFLFFHCGFSKTFQTEFNGIQNAPLQGITGKNQLEQPRKNMKTFKTLLRAILAAVSLTFCATSAKASMGIVTNYDILTLTATFTTNCPVETMKDGYKSGVGTTKFITKDLFLILTNVEFAGSEFPTGFPAGSQLVIGWDEGWNGDVLVVDKTQTNVLFDATSNNGNTNDAIFSINLFKRLGPNSFTERYHPNGIENYSTTEYNIGYFYVVNQTYGPFMAINGPCTEHYTIIGNGTPNIVWSDSQIFSTYGWSTYSSFGSSGTGTLVGKLTATGHGKGRPSALLFFTRY